jgi:diguanylate cyclase (GGDEF)-like protein
LRSAEFIGRLGGEEFVFVLCPCDETTAGHVMERGRVACAEPPFATSVGDLEVTVSLGAAMVHDLDGVELSVVLNVADQALYRAKENGRNRAVLDAVNSPAAS